MRNAREILKNKTAIVTGASSGIGKAVCDRLAENDVNLIMIARREERLKDLAKEYEKRYGIKTLFKKLDMSKTEEIKQFVESLSNEWSNIDILINNAGFAIGRDNYREQNIEDAVNMLKVNCEGLIVMTRLVLPFLLKSKDAHIINLASTAADTAYAGGAIYCATKSFVEMFGDVLRIELMDKPVRVCNIKPGLVNTEFSTVRFKGDKEKADSVYKGFDPLYAEDIADNIEYVLTRPNNVQIASMTIMASSQGSASLVYKK